MGSAAKVFGPLLFAAILGCLNIVESDSNLCPFSEVMTRESRDWVSVEP